ncbi:unnamed protein product [Mytilus coruscus]|uniref:Uncharacterized protein n=1 Tax=Mytilus coruscus TaxID=42192 RepID=A0A6J8DSZ2_MYTCO|nr:unnamed protein product [Mytilus coruscus]
MCSRLLDEFSTQHNEQMCVAYMEVFKDTDRKAAMKFLTENNNICCIPLRDLQQDQQHTLTYHMKQESMCIQKHKATVIKNRSSTCIHKLLHEEEMYISRRMRRRQKFKTRNHKIISEPRERKKDFIRDSYRLDFTMFNYDGKNYGNSFVLKTSSKQFH